MLGKDETEMTIAAASVNRLALICDSSREHVRKIIERSSIRPSGERSGHAVYLIREVVMAVCGCRVATPGDHADPQTLPAAQRKAWYDSECQRLRLAKEAGALLAVEDVQLAFAQIYSDVSHELSMIPDILERDMQVPGEYTERFIELVQHTRERICQRAQARTDRNKDRSAQAW